MTTTTYELPLEWYIARLDYLYQEFTKIPDIRVGRVYDVSVFRIYDSNEKVRQRNERSKDWDACRYLYEQRRILKERISSLEERIENIYHVSYNSERPKFKILKNTTARMNMDFFNTLVDDECPYPKNFEYEFDGHCFRSRFELAIAQVIKDLGIGYKYDSGFQIGNRVLYPDFTLAFPEFNCCNFLEALGRLDSPKYVNDSVEKIRDYSNNGFILDLDYFLIGAGEKTMPNNLKIRMKLVELVGSLCATYVISV